MEMREDLACQTQKMSLFCTSCDKEELFCNPSSDGCTQKPYTNEPAQKHKPKIKSRCCKIFQTDISSLSEKRFVRDGLHCMEGRGTTEQVQPVESEVKRFWNGVLGSHSLDWMLQGRTILIPKEGCVGRPEQYGPITCLNTSYNLLTGILEDHADRNGLLPHEQKAVVSCETEF